MAPDEQSVQRIPGYCGLCVSKCGSVATVENGRFIALEPDPTHPTGKALCAKGRAAPELVNNSDRLLYPLKRTRPKGDADPGWQRISWDEALDLTADRLRAIAAESGPESVVFTAASPSTSALDDALPWIPRLMNAFGSPNMCAAMELCGWGRHQATTYTFGAPVPGAYMPDLERAGCILYWGYNPNLARLSHAVATTTALKRGARLIVVDPRRAGPANKADVWLCVRPGTDAALALGITHLMIERGWYDRDFVREWTNAPLLVRSDNSRLLTMAELDAEGSASHYVAWNDALSRPTPYDPATGAYDAAADLALTGAFPIETLHGQVECRPIFALMADSCRQYDPATVESICGVAGDQIERAARMLWESRPVAYYAWSGVEMQTGSTQIARAIAQLYTLTGSFDSPGGNVLFPAIPSGNTMGMELMAPEQRKRTLGLAERPLGPARWGFVSTDDVYRGILEQRPYPVRGIVGFGSNLLLSHADSDRGREALANLDFFVHTDLFMNPTAEMADIVLPVASCFETEALKMGFEGSAEAHALVQLRPRIVEPRGEARSDTQIVFDLACRLGLGAHFWDGDIDAALRYRLEPSGISLEALRVDSRGTRIPLQTRYRKFAERNNGMLQGFATPSRKIELYSETFLQQGYPPLPDYAEPLMSPISRPDLAERFPLILTCAKQTVFCESQHRALPSLRRLAPEPEVELHPLAAEQRGIAPGDWVTVETPGGQIRVRAKFNDALEPRVACAQHGWWQACPELGLPGHDPLSAAGANLNRIIGNEAIDPISGSVPHRAYLCEIRRAE